MMERYSSQDVSVTTLYGTSAGLWPLPRPLKRRSPPLSLGRGLLFCEAIRIRVVVESCRARFPTEPALFDSWKLEVQVLEDTVIVEEYCAGFDSISHRLRAVTILRPERGA